MHGQRPEYFRYGPYGKGAVEKEPVQIPVILLNQRPVIAQTRIHSPQIGHEDIFSFNVLFVCPEQGRLQNQHDCLRPAAPVQILRESNCSRKGQTGNAGINGTLSGFLTQNLRVNVVADDGGTDKNKLGIRRMAKILQSEHRKGIRPDKNPVPGESQEQEEKQKDEQTQKTS